MMGDYTYQSHWLYCYLETGSTNERDGGIYLDGQTARTNNLCTDPLRSPIFLERRGRGGVRKQATYKLLYVRRLDCRNGAKRCEQEKQRGVG